MSSDRKCRLQASLPLSYPPSLAVPSSYIHCLALSPGPLSPVAFTTWTVAPQAGVEQTIKGLIFLIKLGSQRHPVFCRDLLKGGGGAGSGVFMSRFEVHKREQLPPPVHCGHFPTPQGHRRAGHFSDRAHSSVGKYCKHVIMLLEN